MTWFDERGTGHDGGGVVSGSILHFDFVKGEVREVSESEHRRMVAEQMERTIIKNGVVYIDCEPPADEERACPE